MTLSRQPEDFRRSVRSKEKRKARSRRQPKTTIWQGFSTFGLVGWSISLPTVLMVLLGIWLDKNHAAGFSWTLALLVAGLGLGCLNAWYWVSRKMEELKEEGEPDEKP